MSNGREREYQHPKGGPMASYMCRCDACKRWWSVSEFELVQKPRCACGGALVEVDMEKHLATVPKAKPEPDPGKIPG